MKEIKLFGRGGQGTVTAAQILASAAFSEGKYAQTFPQFGAERRGAPVLAYVRVDDAPITLRNKVYQPDVVMIMDQNLFKMTNPFQGLKPGGVVIINGEVIPAQLSTFKVDHSVSIHLINASFLAEELYGNTSIPIVNVIFLGAYCRALGDIKIESVNNVLPDYFPAERVDLNRRAAQLGFDNLRGIPWST